MDDWMFAVNWNQITDRAPRNAGQEGHGVAVNYDLGGGADVQLGYSMSKCKKFIVVPNADLADGPVYEDAALKCRANEAEETNYSTFSLGVAMIFWSGWIHRFEGGPIGSPYIFDLRVATRRRKKHIDKRFDKITYIFTLGLYPLIEADVLGMAALPVASRQACNRVLQWLSHLAMPFDM